MNRVQEAIQASHDGTGTFDEVREVVATFRFGRPPEIRSLKDLGENWDYREVTDSFRDTVEVAYFEGKLSLEQVNELRDVVRARRKDRSK
jgi:hypothetical protein